MAAGGLFLRAPACFYSLIHFQLRGTSMFSFCFRMFGGAFSVSRSIAAVFQIFRGVKFSTLWKHILQCNAVIADHIPEQRASNGIAAPDIESRSRRHPFAGPHPLGQQTTERKPRKCHMKRPRMKNIGRPHSLPASAEEPSGFRTFPRFPSILPHFTEQISLPSRTAATAQLRPSVQRQKTERVCSSSMGIMQLSAPLTIASPQNSPNEMDCKESLHSPFKRGMPDGTLTGVEVPKAACAVHSNT